MLPQDLHEARLRAESEASHAGSLDAYYHHSPERSGSVSRGASGGRADSSAHGRLVSLLDGEKGRKQTLAQHFHDAVLEAGWLDKRGGGTRVLGSKGYKRRWFELVRTVKGIYLTYQSEPSDGMLKGAIKMSKARVQSDPNRRFSVHITHETKGTRSYHIKAPSLEEKFSWLRSINSLQVCTHCTHLPPLCQCPCPTPSPSPPSPPTSSPAHAHIRPT